MLESFLGIKITDTFNWKTHCDDVASKLKSTAYRLSMLRVNLNFPAIRTVCFADVQSHILYTKVKWGCSPHMQQIFINQKRCISELWQERGTGGHLKPLSHANHCLKNLKY
jgi:hypothetical protein